MGDAADIRLAGPEDLPDVMAGLRALAADLGDPFRADEAVIARALFGAQAHSFAVLVPGPMGVALCSPIVSTVSGFCSVYVSDLWVSASARGQALGRALLAAAAREGRARWGAGAIRLLVYAENDGAQGFYRRLGFDIGSREHVASLRGAALASLLGEDNEG